MRREKRRGTRVSSNTERNKEKVATHDDDDDDERFEGADAVLSLQTY